MMPRFLFQLVLLAALVVGGCDYSIVEQEPSNPTGPGNPGAVSIVVTPGAATIRPGDSLRLRAIVTGAADTSALWSIVSGAGSLSATGLFVTAQDTGTTVVRARAAADTTKSATATITVARESSGEQVRIAITPSAVTLEVGTSQQLTAIVSGTENGAVTWSILDGAPGTITAAGLYTAPASIATVPTVLWVQAVSVASPGLSARARVTLTVPVDPNRICFDRQILPLISQSCGKGPCHSPARREEGFDFTKASGILRAVKPFQSFESKLYRSITADEAEDLMPRDTLPLTAAQLDLIRRWIDSGADTTSCPPRAGACDTSGVSYAGFIRPLIADNCVTCHTGATSYNKYVDLSSYAGVRGVALGGRLYGAVSHTPGYSSMPQGRKLDDCAIDMIKAWVMRGAPDN